MISKNYKFEKKWRKRKVKEYSKGIYVKFKPEEGDETVINAYGYRFSVMSVKDKVIQQVMIKKLAKTEEPKAQT